MKLSLIVVVLAACLLTHSVAARASQPQLAGFSDFLTGHQFLDEVGDFFEDRIDDVEDAYETVSDGVGDAWETTSKALGDGWNWTKDEFEKARSWARKVNLQSVINRAAKIAIESAHAGTVAYVQTVQAASTHGLNAATAFAKGDYQTAAKLAVEAGLTIRDAKTNAFKAALLKGLKGVGLAKAGVFLTRLEKRLNSKAKAYAKKYGKHVLPK